mgnify:CR=1 FL=1
MRILQIDIACNAFSTGRIVEGIGEEVLLSGGDSYVAYGRYSQPSQSLSIRIGNDLDAIFHLVLTRLFDKHGLGSRRATKMFLNIVTMIKPDIIHLHDIHGYYLNYPVLFRFIKEHGIPVVWTHHSCWAFTGHCAHFDKIDCIKWKTLCQDCTLIRDYPASYFIDNSKRNYLKKKSIFTSIDRIENVAVSKWMEALIRESFLKIFPVRTIYNGIDTKVFMPKKNEVKKTFQIEDKFLILGVAAKWTKEKGLYDFFKLSKYLDKKEFAIMLLGLESAQIKELPKGIIGIRKIDNVQKLAEYYSAADLFLNPTWQDTFPTTNLESLACGTPVITYDTGGSGEGISKDTGFVTKKGDIQSIIDIIKNVKKTGKQCYSEACRNRVITLFRQEDRFKEYLSLYKEILETKHN